MSIVLFQHSGAGPHILGQNELVDAFLEPKHSVGMPQRIDRPFGSVAIGVHPGGFQQSGEGLLERPDGRSIPVTEDVVVRSRALLHFLGSDGVFLLRSLFLELARPSLQYPSQVRFQPLLVRSFRSQRALYPVAGLK